MSEKVKNIPTILIEISDQFCENYCKYSHAYGEDDASQLQLMVEHCDTCPMRMLQ